MAYGQRRQLVKFKSMRKVIFILLCVFMSGISGIARTSRVVTTVARAPKTSVSTSKVATSVQKAASKATGAEKAARQATAVSGGAIRLLPALGHTIQNLSAANQTLDSILRESKRRRLVGPIIPSQKLPKFKSSLESINKRMAETYPAAKELIAQGLFDKYPMMLFVWANYAKLQGDDDVAVEFMGHIDPMALTPAILYKFSNAFPAIQEYGPELVRSLNMIAYTQMAKAKYAGTDCDSARMQAGDTLMIVTDKYRPYLTPLAELSCFYDPSKEIGRYKVAADSLLTNYSRLTQQFKDVFFSDFLSTLYNADEYKTAIEYFERAPLKSYPDSLADFTLRLASCAIGLNDSERFDRYVKQALTIDSVAAQDYWEGIYSSQLDYFIANPTQTEVADWLLENTDYPADAALDAAIAVMSHYFPDDQEDNWEWPDSTTYTTAQLTARDGIIYILDRICTLDISNADLATLANIDYLKASLICTLDHRTAEAVDILDRSSRELTKNPATETDNTRCLITIMQAYIAGHGLDKPKKAMKILQKNITQLDLQGVSNDTRSSWYHYMALLSKRSGKTNDYEKYIRLKENFDVKE